MGNNSICWGAGSKWQKCMKFWYRNTWSKNKSDFFHLWNLQVWDDLSLIVGKARFPCERWLEQCQHFPESVRHSIWTEAIGFHLEPAVEDFFALAAHAFGIYLMNEWNAWTGTWTLDPQIKSLMLYRLSYPGSAWAAQQSTLKQQTHRK